MKRCLPAAPQARVVGTTAPTASKADMTRDLDSIVVREQAVGCRCRTVVALLSSEDKRRGRRQRAGAVGFPFWDMLICVDLPYMVTTHCFAATCVHDKFLSRQVSRTMDSNYGAYMPSLIVVLISAAFSLIVTQRTHRSPSSTLRDPPGPKGIPFFGNEFQIPQDKQWLRFHEWSQKYGAISCGSRMG